MPRFPTIACAAAVLAIGAPAISSVRTESPRCGAKLVAGWARCMDEIMKISEHRSLEAKALKGDNDAAMELAAFHLMARENTVAYRWLRLAAERGDCAAMRDMLDRASGAEAAKWDARRRAAKCRG